MAVNDLRDPLADENEYVVLELARAIASVWTVSGDKFEKRSYANIAAVPWAETGEAGTYEFVRRLVFSVLIGNADMHLKNLTASLPTRFTQ